LGISLVPQFRLEDYQAVVLAVAHREFKDLPLEPNTPNRPYVVYDTKAFLPVAQVDGRL
jgi:UDP-N-acetyl-D-galactosamine dehydrogenase